MTREEKASLLAGVDDWHFHGVPRLGVPSIRVTDCGHGVTLCGEDSSPATCFPTGIGMAATWNRELLERVGSVIGRECRALGCSLLLGPKINLHRHPLNGRSFETFSEDPWLAGLLGAAVIRGIQSQGVGACVKAMAANNQQQDQEHVSSEVDERTLREIYLRAFEIAIQEGNPCAIMTAYNRLNGTYCSESEWLIKNIIKSDWNFPGFVLSDWRAVHGEAVYRSGLDLEMPGPGKLLNQKAVLHAIDEGFLTNNDLDDSAGRILKALLLYGKDESETEGFELDTPENRAVALQTAEESIVLLKNHDHLLPLDKNQLKRILVTGPNALRARLGGGGSASVTPFYSVSPLEGIREICGSEVDVRFLEGCSLVGTMETITDHFSHVGMDHQRVDGLEAQFFNSPNSVGEVASSQVFPNVDFSWGWASPGPGVYRGSFSVQFAGELTPPVTGRYRLGVYAQEGCVRLSINGLQVIDTWDGEDDSNFEKKYQTHYLTTECDLEAGKPVSIVLIYGKRAARAAIRFEWEIPGVEDRMENLLREAEEADAVVVCAGLSNLFEGGSCDRSHIDLPESQRSLIERVASVNPRTIVALNSGGVLAMPWEPAVPAILQAWYPGQEGGRALARILFGDTNPSACLPDTIPRRLEDHAAIRNYPGDGKMVKYEEGLFIGYRHFDRADIEPHFPFGFGLSYTEFEFSRPSLSSTTMTSDENIRVELDIKNIGQRQGQVVVQLYIRPISPPVERPEKELRAFQKVHLASGKRSSISFTIGRRELEYFDSATSSWRVSPGRYELVISRHSRSMDSVSAEIEVKS